MTLRLGCRMLQQSPSALCSPPFSFGSPRAFRFAFCTTRSCTPVSGSTTFLPSLSLWQSPTPRSLRLRCGHVVTDLGEQHASVRFSDDDESKTYMVSFLVSAERGPAGHAHGAHNAARPQGRPRRLMARLCFRTSQLCLSGTVKLFANSENVAECKVIVL
jgi:hypothetical protein